MEPVVWGERYATGHSGIDTQHQVLFRLLEQSRLGIDVPNAKDYQQIVLGLLKYVIEHFSYEYSLMREYGYPGQEEHHRCHQQLTQQAVAFKSTVFANQDARAELTGFMVGWVQHHIDDEDVRLSAYLKKAGAGGL